MPSSFSATSKAFSSFSTLDLPSRFSRSTRSFWILLMRTLNALPSLQLGPKSLISIGDGVPVAVLLTNRSRMMHKNTFLTLIYFSKPKYKKWSMKYRKKLQTNQC